jgi:hypothetical protein
MFVTKRSLKIQVVGMLIGVLIQSLNLNSAHGEIILDKDALPVRVGGVTVYVVPVSKMPDTLRKSLQGKSAFVVVDSSGRLVKDKDVIYQALLTFIAVRNSIDDPISPGWDTKRAKRTASLYRKVADDLRRIVITRNLIALSDEAAQLGARLLVLSVVPQPPFSAMSSTVKAFLEPATDPKQIARLLLSVDIIAAEAQLGSLANQLEQISSYPIDSSLAPNLIMADMVGIRLGATAALARIELEESDPIWTSIKTALDQLRNTLMSQSSQHIVHMTNEVYDLGKRIFNLLKQTKGMASYLRERERMINNWYLYQMNIHKMAESISNIVKNLPF